MTPKAETLESQKSEIQTIGLSAIKNYLLIDPSEVTEKELLTHLLQKAKIGMQFEKEMNLNHRATEMNSIRIYKLTAEDRGELKKLLKSSLPKYFK